MFTFVKFKFDGRVVEIDDHFIAPTIEDGIKRASDRVTSDAIYSVYQDMKSQPRLKDFLGEINLKVKRVIETTRIGV